ncbi:hypothetical protein ACFQY7_17005 [Actinomadura luteofluorescens]|uniref:hypothetical protein n=1 Tax=Actinomadura luteofluorescens TaxID=46163 RepID=UPI00364132BB
MSALQGSLGIDGVRPGGLAGIHATRSGAGGRGHPTPTPVDAALAKAKQTGDPVEIAGQTSETRKLSALPDGQFSFETSPVPVRVKRDGVFRDADLTLERTAEGGYASRMSVNGVTFGAGGDDELATMTKDGKSLTLTWPGASLPVPGPGG